MILNQTNYLTPRERERRKVCQIFKNQSFLETKNDKNELYFSPPRILFIFDENVGCYFFLRARPNPPNGMYSIREQAALLAKHFGADYPTSLATFFFVFYEIFSEFGDSNLGALSLGAMP